MCLQIENLEKNTLGSWLVNTHTKNTSRGSTGSFVLFMVKRKRLSSACWIQLGFILLKCWDKDSPRHRGNQGHVKRPLIVLGFKRLELYSHWMPYGTENCDKLSTSQMGWKPGRPIGEQVFFSHPFFPPFFKNFCSDTGKRHRAQHLGTITSRTSCSPIGRAKTSPLSTAPKWLFLIRCNVWQTAALHAAQLLPCDSTCIRNGCRPPPCT